MLKPHDNLAVVAASPRGVALGEKVYPVSKLTPRMAGRLQALIMDRIPDPRDKARKIMEGLPEAVQIHIYERACDDARGWPPSLGSPEGLAVMMSPAGMALLVELTVAPNVAGFTAADAEALADRMTMEDFHRLMEVSAPGDPHAPKGTAESRPPGAS